MRTALIPLQYQPYISEAPQRPQDQYSQACSNDKVTIDSWRDTWIRQYKENHDKFGSFGEHSIGKLFQAHAGKPAILAGSGPSLAYNGEQLKNKGCAVLVSALHNFHFFEDRDIEVDYYVTLDAGPVTIEEVAEGGGHDAEWYWERSASKVLIAHVGTHPELLAKWRGKVYFFNCPIPDKSVMEELEKVEQFNTFLSTGGNVLGACLYFAKGFLGCSISAFVGADFSFSYESKFHGWDSKYDAKMGECLRVVDVFGIPVKTWPSYYNFKVWFDWVASNVPGLYINCTEGGCFGAYQGGNILAVKQMELAAFLAMINMSEHVREQATDPLNAPKKVLF